MRKSSGCVFYLQRPLLILAAGMAKVGSVRCVPFYTHIDCPSMRFKLIGNLSQQATGKVADGIPNAEETNSDDGEEYQHNVPRMNADGVGIDHEVTLAGA